MNLSYLLDAVSVCEPGTWENDDGPAEWWAVSTNKGIVAYFGNASHAFAFRLWLINATLNPITV
jgi:hypothetical protein